MKTIIIYNIILTHKEQAGQQAQSEPSLQKN